MLIIDHIAKKILIENVWEDIGNVLRELRLTPNPCPFQHSGIRSLEFT